jgi:hypothetical protein
MMDHWVKLLTDSKKRCVEVVPSLSKKDGYPQVFDLWYDLILTCFTLHSL